ncbi:MAG: hypothetical protein RJQ04_09000 [Longimicrobiales bacterium]
MALLIPLRRSAAVALQAAAAAARPVGAQTLTQDEALALAFPGADIDRRTAYLDDAQMERARSLAGGSVAVESGIVTYYVARKDGHDVGVAYFDPHRVRTLPEVLMFVVGRDGRIRRTEVVRFSEPPEYRPPDGWLGLFEGRALDDELSTKGAIPNLTGATLTALAATGAARRILALHAVLAPFEP